MRITIFALALLCFSVSTVKAQATQQQKHFNTKSSIAIEGYDPVSYFNGKPLEGKSALKFTHKGVTYLFSTPANLNKFKSSPDTYEPAYGGWCSYAMGATGEKVKIDPDTYKILDGKLYLFYNFWGNNTLTSWMKEEAKLKQAADKNWGKLLVQ